MNCHQTAGYQSTGGLPCRAAYQPGVRMSTRSAVLHQVGQRNDPLAAEALFWPRCPDNF